MEASTLFQAQPQSSPQPALEMAVSLYSQLDPHRRQIRLLTLLPGQPSDGIECLLKVDSLDCDSPYEALSYVWGPSDKKTQHLCE